MNKPIEFRAWVPQFESYGEVLDIHFSEEGLPDIIEVFVDGSNHHLNASEVIIEQYVGLKDKNGKEVCEGDIVEQFVCGIHQFKGKKCGRRTIWEVRWNKKECCFELHYLSGSLFGDSMMSDGDEYEVIGNIHENSELLGGEE